MLPHYSKDFVQMRQILHLHCQTRCPKLVEGASFSCQCLAKISRILPFVLAFRGKTCCQEIQFNIIPIEQPVNIVQIARFGAAYQSAQLLDQNFL